MFESLCHTIDTRRPQDPQCDGVTLEEFTKQQGAGARASGIASIWTRATMGCEPSELGALYFLGYCRVEVVGFKCGPIRRTASENQGRCVSIGGPIILQPS